VTAATAYTLFHKTPAILAVFGFLFSMPCFYYIVAKPQYATTGRFVLLTYNLTCLFSYVPIHLYSAPLFCCLFGDADADGTIGTIRDSSVTSPSSISLFIAPLLSPSVSFGQALYRGFGGLLRRVGSLASNWESTIGDYRLSSFFVALTETDLVLMRPFRFCLNIGWLYTRLVASNSFLPENPTDASVVVEDDGPNEETPLLPRRLNNSVEEFMAMYVACFLPNLLWCAFDSDIINRELHLQIKLLELQDLLKQTLHEPRLKGPFPIKLYRSILASLQTILDKLHSMRCVTTREEWYVNLWSLEHQL
jgi:hypothetical protein